MFTTVLLCNYVCAPDAAARSQPLSYLFGSEGPSTADVLKERLHMDEKIRHMVSARIVTPAQDIPGELLIGESSLYFVPNNEPSKQDVRLNVLQLDTYYRF